MLTLYAIPVSLYCAKTRIALRYKGLEWTEVPPDGGYGSDAYKALVPAGNLPALRDGDTLVPDSEAIAEYLEERWPVPRLLPDDPAARSAVRALSRFHDTRLEPAVRALFPYLPGRATAPNGFASLQASEINTRLQQLTALLDMQPASDGEVSMGDCGYPATFAWLDALAPLFGLELAWPDDVVQYRQRLMTCQAILTEMTAYEAALKRFLAG